MMEARSRFGGAKQITWTDYVTQGDTTALGTISGKGQIYGIIVRSVGYENDEYDYVGMVVDGESLAAYSYRDLNLYDYTYPAPATPFIFFYDETNHKFAMGITGPITFEDSFVLNYVQVLGIRPYVYAKIIYAILD
jgi:hypothetical protein